MSTFELKPYQNTTVEFGMKNPYAIYGLKMGMGKSLCALETAHRTNSKLLVVCPAYLRLKWKSEVKKFYPDKIAAVFENDKQFYALWDTDIAIISYHYVGKAEVLFKWADMVAFDEGQFLKEMTAKRTLDSHRLVFENSIKSCLILTGTPIQNRVYEFYSLLAICHYNPTLGDKPEFLEKFPTYVHFASHFSHLREFQMMRGGRRVKVQQWEGFKNEDELKEWSKNCYIRFDQTGQKYTEVDVPVSYEENSELLQVFEQFTAKGDQTSVASNVKAKAALAKVPFTVEYVKGIIDQGEQVVVYTDHVESCLALAEKLGVPGITGQMDMKKRQILADEFMAGKSKVIVATIGSFSTGIDLYSAANMVFNDLCWVPGMLEQAMFRILRLGQTRECVIHFILGSIQDATIRKALKEKMETIKAVI